MEKVKETDAKVWVIGLLLILLFVTTIIWLALESVHGGDDLADITRKMYIVGGAAVLLIVSIVFGWWFEETRIRNFEKNIEIELGLKPISKMELFSKYINRHRFYGLLEYPQECIYTERRYHGEYKGYEICIIDPCPAPHCYFWELKRYPWTPAVQIKSSSFHFPKFLIRNKNDFIFHQFEGEKGNYQLLLKHAFIVLELLSKAAPYSSVSEIGKLQEKCKRAHKKNVLWWPCLLIATVLTPILVYLLLFK
jgi:hypothetical protein